MQFYSWFTPSERRLAALFLGLSLLGTGLRWVRLQSPEVDAWLGEAPAVLPESLETAGSVPSGPAPAPARAPAPAAASGDGEGIDPNRAAEAELIRLPGVGPVLARRIIEDRGRNGPFRRPRDLLRVAGIGPATLERMESHLVFP